MSSSWRQQWAPPLRALRTPWEWTSPVAASCRWRPRPTSCWWCPTCTAWTPARSPWARRGSFPQRRMLNWAAPSPRSATITTCFYHFICKQISNRNQTDDGRNMLQVSAAGCCLFVCLCRFRTFWPGLKISQICWSWITSLCPETWPSERTSLWR